MLGWGGWSDGGFVYLVGYRLGDQLKELERRARSREGEVAVEARRVVTPSGGKQLSWACRTTQTIGGWSTW